jgi:hypothetical protein
MGRQYNGKEANMQRGQITDPAAIQQFIGGGNATFTIVSKATGVRFTYKVREPEGGGVHFVKVLRGADNEGDYSYLGFIRGGEYIHGGRKARVGKDAPSARAFGWFHGRLQAGTLPAEQVEFWHEGRCCRCGRKLTVPESIERGIGPECAARMEVAA